MATQTAEEFFGVSRPKLETELDTFYKEAEQALLRANPHLADELKFRSTLPMDQLPFDVRTQLIGKYRNIIAFDESLANLSQRGGKPMIPAVQDAKGIAEDLKEGVSNIYQNLRTTVGAGTTNPYGRLPGETSGSLLSNIYSRINVQFRSELKLDRAGIVSKEGVGATATSHFTMGLNSIPTKKAINTPTYTPGIMTGKSRMVYDIETAGFGKGSIREVAYSTTRAGRGTTAHPTLLFTPTEFNRGMVAIDGGKVPGGNPGTLTDFLRRKFGINPPHLTGGDEFAEGMKPFLQEILNTDYIVGHNISQFDNEQVFVGLSRTKKYKTDKIFSKLVDDAFEKVSTSTVDTMSVVRQMPGLSAIRTAREIRATGSSELFSISNLLIQTDLADRIGLDELGELMGYEAGKGGAAGTFKYGLHHAGVDTAVTGAMLDSADGGGLKLGGVLSGDSVTGKAAEIRRAIVESSAITPFTNITSTEQLTDDVLRRLVNSYKEGGSPLRAKRNSELDKLLKTDPQLAYEKLRSGELKPTRIKLTALEQQIISERNIAAGIDDAAITSSSTLDRIRKFMPGSGLTNAQMQERGKRAGIAFSGLSSEERSLAYQLSEATSGLKSLGIREKRVAGYAVDSMVSRFDLFKPEKVQYITRSGRASMPLQLLQNAGIFSDDEMLTVSFVDPSASSQRSAINVIKEFKKGEATQLQDYLTGLHAGTDEDIADALGLASDDAQAAITNFRKAMNEGLAERLDQRGVSVAQIFEGENPRATQQIGDIFRSFFNVEGQLDDKGMRNVLLPFMGVSKEEGVLRTAGAVWRNGLLGSETQEVAKAVRGTWVAYGQALNMNTAQHIQAKMIAASGAPVEKVSRAYRAASEIIPHLGKGMVGIAAAGIGAVLLKKHQENKVLDETLEFQGYENSTEGQYGSYQQIQQRMEAGYNGYANLMDPLATASITNNLNNNRTAHNDMSWDRNNSIYGGAL